jgi:hypothetical protein
MVATNLPNYLKKKKLLDSPNLPVAECQKYGDLFLEAGWLADALDFFIKGNSAEGFAKLQDVALEPAAFHGEWNYTIMPRTTRN